MLKKNQPELFEDVKFYFDNEKVESFVTLEKFLRWKQMRKFLLVISEHWKIESMHWILDTVFGEDDCNFQSEQAHITINIFLNFSIALHKKYLSKIKIKRSIKQNLLAFLLNDKLLLNVISY